MEHCLLSKMAVQRVFIIFMGSCILAGAALEWKDVFLNTEDIFHHDDNDNGMTLPVEFAQSFKAVDCGEELNPVKLRHIDIIPDPIVAPGSMYLTLEVEVKKTLFPPIALEFEMQRLIQGVWTRMPCLYDYFGSCKYDDICKPFYQLPPICPKTIQKKFPCKCPIEPNIYDTDSTRINLGSPELFMPGIYKTRIEATSLFIKKVMCYTVYFQIVRATELKKHYKAIRRN